MKSTVPVGTGEKVRVGLDARGLAHVGYVSNPEFLAEGTRRARLHEPRPHRRRRVRGGGRRRGRGAVRATSTRPVVRCDVNSAEMIKLAANAFLMTRISFINEIANVCELTGADVIKVAEGVGLDHRLGPHFLRAGIGYGGTCFPKDSLALKQLASNSGYHFQLLAAVIEVNELQKRRVIGKLQKHLGPAARQAVALLGLAFKPHTDDMREAPSIVLASRLLAEGAEVTRVGSRSPTPTSCCAASTCASARSRRCADADAAVIVTEWPELRELASRGDARGDGGNLIVDGRNLLDPDEVRGRRLRLRGHRPAAARRSPACPRAKSEPRARPPDGGDPARRRQGRAPRRRRRRPAEAARPGRRQAARRVPGRPARAGRRRARDRRVRGRHRSARSRRELAGLGSEIVAVEEPEPLGRGGGLRFAAQARSEAGPVYAHERRRAARRRPRRAARSGTASAGAAATITLVPLRSRSASSTSTTTTS